MAKYFDVSLEEGLMFVYAYFVTCENMQSIGITTCVVFCDLL